MKIIMKKILIGTLIAIQVLIGAVGAHTIVEEFIARSNNYWISVDNTYIEYENPVVTINDVTYVPLRETFENIDCEVQWNNGIVKVYTKDKYQENVTANGVRYHLYNNPITFDEKWFDEIKIENMDNVVKKIAECKIIAQNADELIELFCENDFFGVKNSQKRENYWYNIYETTNDLWVVDAQRKVDDLVDTEMFYTINKETGEVTQYWSWGSLYLFNYYLKCTGQNGQGVTNINTPDPRHVFTMN